MHFFSAAEKKRKQDTKDTIGANTLPHFAPFVASVVSLPGF